MKTVARYREPREEREQKERGGGETREKHAHVRVYTKSPCRASQVGIAESSRERRIRTFKSVGAKALARPKVAKLGHAPARVLDGARALVRPRALLRHHLALVDALILGDAT